MVLNCTAPGVTLHKLGRWKTAGSRGTHALTVLDITGLTLPTQSNLTRLVAATSVDLAARPAAAAAAAAAGDQLGFWYATLAGTVILSRFVGLFLLNLPCTDKDDTE